MYAIRGKFGVAETSAILKDGENLIQDGENLIKDCENTIKDSENLMKDYKQSYKDCESLIKNEGSLWGGGSARSLSLGSVKETAREPDPKTLR